jgi:hypothetical protein
MISAACHQVIFFAIAFNSTSRSFIIRSIALKRVSFAAISEPE